MKHQHSLRTYYFFLLIIIFSILLSSCKGDKTYINNNVLYQDYEQCRQIRIKLPKYECTTSTDVWVGLQVIPENLTQVSEGELSNPYSDKEAPYIFIENFTNYSSHNPSDETYVDMTVCIPGGTYQLNYTTYCKKEIIDDKYYGIIGKRGYTCKLYPEASLEKTDYIYKDVMKIKYKTIFECNKQESKDDLYGCNGITNKKFKPSLNYQIKFIDKKTNISYYSLPFTSKYIDTILEEEINLAKVSMSDSRTLSLLPGDYSVVILNHSEYPFRFDHSYSNIKNNECLTSPHMKNVNIDELSEIKIKENTLTNNKPIHRMLGKICSITDDYYNESVQGEGQCYLITNNDHEIVSNIYVGEIHIY